MWRMHSGLIFAIILLGIIDTLLFSVTRVLEPTKKLSIAKLSKFFKKFDAFADLKGCSQFCERFAKKMIKIAPNNGSSWNYLLGYVVAACHESDLSSLKLTHG